MLPDYLIDSHRGIPKDRPISMLIRHSARFPITSAAEVWTAGLTPEGIEMASKYGGWLSRYYKISKIETSPITRCIDTGKYISTALSEEVEVAGLDVLAHPNENAEYDSLADYLINKRWPDRISQIAAYLVPNGHHQDGLNIFISHDTVLIAMTAYWMDLDVRDGELWPRFMEPFFMWWQTGELMASFRGETKNVQRVFETHLANHITEKNSISEQSLN